MRHRTAQSLLIGAAGLMGCASIGCLLWPALSAPPRQSPDPASAPGRTDGIIAPASSVLTREAFAQVSELDLRRPLRDPPAPPPPAPPAPKAIPPLTIRLTGTIFEPGHCRAVILLPDGKVQLMGVGESAGDARILQIENGKVTVDYFGQSLILTVHEEKHS